MSPPPSLAEILARARAAARPGAPRDREIEAAGGTAERAAAILAEIDETVLPRALVFGLGKGRELVLEARARRALRITGATPEAVWTKALRDTLGKAGETDAQDAAALAAMIARFAAAEAALTVRSQPATLPPSFVDRGHSAEELAALLPEEARSKPGKPAPAKTKAKRADKAKPAGPALRAWIEACPPLMAAAVFADAKGKPTQLPEADGAAMPAADLARLASEAAAQARPFASAAIGDGPLLFVALPRAASAPALCLGFEAGAVAAAPLAADELGTLLAAWRDLAAGGGD